MLLHRLYNSKGNCLQHLKTDAGRGGRLCVLYSAAARLLGETTEQHNSSQKLRDASTRYLFPYLLFHVRHQLGPAEVSSRPSPGFPVPGFSRKEWRRR
jgi:hypothetical protein